jgi:hypothetical protein
MIRLIYIYWKDEKEGGQICFWFIDKSQVARYVKRSDWLGRNYLAALRSCFHVIAWDPAGWDLVWYDTSRASRQRDLNRWRLAPARSLLSWKNWTDSFQLTWIRSYACIMDPLIWKMVGHLMHAHHARCALMSTCMKPDHHACRSRPRSS